VGVAFLPVDGVSHDALLEAADGMLSLAVLAGGNGVRTSVPGVGVPSDDDLR